MTNELLKKNFIVFIFKNLVLYRCAIHYVKNEAFFILF